MASDKGGSDVSIVRSHYDDIDMDSLLRPIGGIARYVANGDRVLLKVNLLSASEPRTAVTTHPAVVASVARAVMDAGGVPVIADSPAGMFNEKALRKAYEASGFARVALDLGINLNWNTGSTSIAIPGAVKLKRAKICDFVPNADRIIALPKLKTHVHQVMTLATKVMYGIVPGLEKGRLHAVYPTRAAFADMLLDVLSVRPPDLFILDGVLAMQGEGPGSGTPVETGILMASTDPVAMDVSVCEMLGIETMGVPTIKRARFRGMYPSEVRYPSLSPGDVRFEGFKLPATAGRMARGRRASRSPVITDRCTACGACEEICPKDAISIPGDRAVVDLEECIRCYCCHEVCPDNAVQLKRVMKR